MIWNQLNYDLQQKVIDRIVSLLETEEDPAVQEGLIAAVHELEVWSNSPCKVIGEHGFEEKDPFGVPDFWEPEFTEDDWDLDK